MTFRHALPLHWRQAALALFAALMAGLSAPPGWAQMADPTRPILGVFSSERGAPLNPGANQPEARAYVSPSLPLPGRVGQPAAPDMVQSSVQGRAVQGGTAPGTPRLSSVMVGPPGVACAVIDGQVVKVGERIRGDMLVSVDRTGVLLKGAQGSTRLNLLSRIEMPAAAPPATAAPEGAASTPVATSPADTLGVARKEMP